MNTYTEDMKAALEYFEQTRRPMTDYEMWCMAEHYGQNQKLLTGQVPEQKGDSNANVKRFEKQ